LSQARGDASGLAALTALPTFIVKGPAPAGSLSPFGGSPSTLSAPFTPAQIEHAYGVDAISFSEISGDGTGQTIAIVGAYNDPTLVADAAGFNTRFALPQFNVSGGPTLTVLNQTGG